MSHDDYEREPIPGLPERLPEGEHIVWQGGPDRHSFLRNVLHARKLTLYFAALVVWRIGVGTYDSKGLVETAISALWAVALGAVVLGLAWWFARAVERTTVYTITNKRVVMRFGVALPITFNYPFSQIVSADIIKLGNGHGTIALTLKEHTKISWPILWPHARPWKLARPQPAIRTIGNIEEVAAILADGLSVAHGPKVVSAKPPVAPSTIRTPQTAPVGEFQMEGA